MQNLGAYSLLEAVGVGSTGTVWRAVHRDIGRVVAVKVLSPEVFDERLQSEARILASLDHPNIVKVYDFAEAGRDGLDEPAWLAEEWVDGARLDVFVSHLGTSRLTGEQAVGVVRGALQGLAHAHAAGVVHGDISAGNILIDHSGTSMLIDFGLASPVGGAAISGTPAFISPEAALGRQLIPASDVYSSAAVLYYLLDGRAPFGADAASAIKGHVADPPPALAGNGEMSILLARAMAKQPADRPENAAAFLAELEDAARRKYGSDWLTRSSIAGLAAAGGAAMVRLDRTDGTTDAVTNNPIATAVTTAENNEPAVPRSRSRSRIRTRTKLAAGGGAVVIVAAVATVAIAGSDTGKSTAGPAPAKSGTVTSSATPGGKKPAVAALSGQLVGSYSVARTLTRLTYRGPLTQPRPETWRISHGCNATPCSIDVSTSTGQTFPASFDGNALTIHFGPGIQTSPCFDAKGVVIPDTQVHEDDSGLTFKLAVRYQNGVASSFSGSGVFTVHQTVTGNCTAFNGTLRDSFSSTRI
jgi:serine/threonine-protein kinase